MYIIQVFDDEVKAYEDGKPVGEPANKWVNTRWTNEYLKQQDIPYIVPTTKKLAQEALKLARSLFPGLSYIIVRA